MNWKNYVEKKNAKTFVLPDGWDSRDAVAEQLECSPEKVDDHLRPALKSGEVIKQQFTVWDDNLKRKTLVTAYQEAPKIRPTPPDESQVATIIRMKDEGKQWAEIGLATGMSGDAARGIHRRHARP